MIKKIAWEAFKNTGDINTYLELKQIEKNDLNTGSTKFQGNFVDKQNLQGKEEL